MVKESGSCLWDDFFKVASKSLTEETIAKGNEGWRKGVCEELAG